MMRSPSLPEHVVVRKAVQIAWTTVVGSVLWGSISQATVNLGLYAARSQQFQSLKSQRMKSGFHAAEE